MKKPFVCRYCGSNQFIKKPMPKFVGLPPAKVGVVCLSCEETLVVSMNDFIENFLIVRKA
jgi:hypothetical protein